MSILIWVLLLVVVLWLVFHKRPACASAKVVSGNGKTRVMVSVDSLGSESLMAMALCYAAKIRWLIVSEPEMSNAIYSNVLNSTLNNWPNVPDVDMRSSLNDTDSEFVVNLYRRGGGQYYVVNTMPSSVYCNDLVTHYFFLLREILGKLNKSDSEILRDAFSLFASKKIPKDPSVGGLLKLNATANDIFQAIVMKNVRPDKKTF